MKFFYLLLSIVISTGCSSQKNVSSLEKLKTERSFNSSNCPEDGTCELKLIPNKSLNLKKDEFGQLYGEEIDSDMILVSYSYHRNAPKNAVDAHYSETYYFSIPKNTKNLDISDADLQNVNLVVDRQCYCKGTAGFFKISSGKLTLNIKKNELTLNGIFSNKNLPLIITKVDEKVSLE